MSQKISNLTYLDYFITLYLKEIGPIRTITSTEEKKLINEYQNGSEKAFEELVLNNQYIVLEEVIYFQGRELELLELLQNANIALIVSLKRYSIDMGPLKNYLHRNIYRHLDNLTSGFYSIIRYPVNKIRDLKNFIEERCENGNNVNETRDHEANDDLYAFLHNENIQSITEASNRLDINIDTIYNDTLDSIQSDLIYDSFKTDLTEVLASLTEREQQIIRMYYGIGRENMMTLEEIGVSFKPTRERIRQVKKDAIKRLQHASRSKVLKQYLDLFDSDPKFITSNKYKNIYFKGISENEDNALIQIKDYVAPRRRKTPYPNITNIAEMCRKIIHDYIEQQNKAVSFDEINSYVYSQLPLLKSGTISYAISTSLDVISTHNNVYVLKKWLQNEESEDLSNDSNYRHYGSTDCIKVYNSPNRSSSTLI